MGKFEGAKTLQIAGQLGTPTAAAQFSAGAAEVFAQQERLLIARSPHVPWVLDRQGNLIGFHQQWFELTGQSEECSSGLGWLEVVHPDCRPVLMAATGLALANQEAFDVHFLCRTKTGQYRWMRARGTAHHEPSRDVIWYGLTEDIHDQVLAAEALRESEEHYRYSVELSGQVPWGASPNGKIEMAASGWKALTGKKLDQAPGGGWVKALHRDDRAAALAAWRKSVKTGAPYAAEFRVRMADASCRWVRARAAPRRDRAGNIARWYGMMEDIHEHKLREQALLESEERLRLAADAADLCTWDYNMVTGKALWNERFQEFVAVPPMKALAPGGLAKVVHPDDYERVQAELDVLFGPCSSGEYRNEHRVIGSDGTVRWVTARGRVHFEHDRPVRFVGTFVDISAYKAAEQALRESEAHYRSSIELSPHIAWVAEPNGAAVEFGPWWHELTGLSAQQSCGDGWTKGIYPDDLPGKLAAWLHSVHTGAPYNVEFRILLQDGSTRWFRSRGAPRRDENGQIVRWYGAFEDINEQKLAQQALSESEEHYRYSVELSPEVQWTASPDGGIEMAGPRWNELTGQSLEAVRGDGWLASLHPEDVRPTADVWQRAVRSGSPYDAQYRMRLQSGEYRWFRSRAAPRRNENGDIFRWYGSLEDVHQQRLAEEALRDSEERFRLAAQAAGLGVWDHDAETGTLTWSDELRIILGVTADTVAEFATALSHAHPDDRWQVEQFLQAAHSDDHSFRFEATVRIYRSSDGELRWVTTNGWKTMKAGRVSRVIITVRDITDEKTAEERIRWTATHDALTRLPNRALFQEELIQAIEHAKAATGRVGLLLVDVDHFKQINDTLGHDAGDALLQTLGARMRASLRAGDMVARLGGDEFAIILPDVADEDGIATAVDSITKRLREPFIHAGRIIDCRATIGASLYPDHATGADDLLKNADIALYSAKAAGRGRMSVFRPEMRADMQRRASMLFLAREAVEKDLITPYYQPKVDMRSGQLVGFEALLRWIHPRSGVQLPGTIEAAFEDLDLANAISDRMFDCVVSDLRRWLDAGLQFGHVAVNASAAEFRHDDLAERILGRLQAAGVPPSFLEVEVTESVFLGRGSEHIERALRKLSDAGVCIALDDFGTGFASLSHLKQFPIDIIKIDRSFVSNLQRDQNDAAIVDAVLSLSRSLGIRVVAEGIESQAQAEYLRQHGCDYGQGWLYARAQPADVVPASVIRWRDSGFGQEPVL